MWSSYVSATVLVCLGFIFITFGIGIALDAKVRDRRDAARRFAPETTTGPYPTWPSPFGSPGPTLAEMEEQAARRLRAARLHLPYFTLKYDGFDLSRNAQAALSGDPRFKGVGVFASDHVGGLTLFGRVATENDKWDARDLLWRALGN